MADTQTPPAAETAAAETAETAAAAAANAEPETPAAANGETETPAAKPTSKTIVLTGHGGYDKLKIQQQERAEPGEGEVLVNVKASGVNFSELMCRAGMYDKCPKPPAVLGWEAAGTVAALGQGVDKFKEGDRVLCLQAFGLWTEFAAVNVNNVFAIPDEMTFEEAAALPVTYVTAHIILFNFGNLRPNQSVLIHMAAGGVGTAATQLCKTVDNVTIFGTASEEKHDKVKDNGVTHVIDYRSQDYVAEIKKINPEGVDLVMDPLAGDDAAKGYNLLKPLGKIVHYGGANFVSGPTKNYLQILKTWWNTKTVNPISLMQHNKAVCGVNLGHMTDQIETLSAVLEEVLQLYKDGKIKPVIDSVWAFEDVDLAMQKMHDRKNVGKVVISTEKEPEVRPEPEPKKKKEKKSKKEKKDKKEEKKEEEKETIEEKKEEEKKDETKEEAKSEKTEEKKENGEVAAEKIEEAAADEAPAAVEEKKGEE